MLVKELIEQLEKLDGDDLVVMRVNGSYIKSYRSPIIGETTLVKESSPGNFVDMVDRERDRDITAYIL